MSGEYIVNNPRHIGAVSNGTHDSRCFDSPDYEEDGTPTRYNFMTVKDTQSMSSFQVKYAIRRISDQFYLPQPAGRNGRGGSFVEPVDPLNTAENIRFFHTKQAAKISLTAWLKGHWLTSRGQSTSGPDWDSEYYEDTEVKPVEGRNKDDMEVVEIKVLLPGKTKPVWHLVGAVFFGNGVLWGDVVETDHPHYHTPEEVAKGEHVKVSRILWRNGDNVFETANSVYVVTEWLPNARSTIPLDLDRNPEGNI